jgi:hypothetical protein
MTVRSFSTTQAHNAKIFNGKVQDFSGSKRKANVKIIDQRYMLLPLTTTLHGVTTQKLEAAWTSETLAS